MPLLPFYLALLLCAAAFGPAQANTKFQSTQRARVEVNAVEGQTLQGCIFYYDYWHDAVNHSALYLFFKNGQNEPLVIDQLRLENSSFSARLSTDRQGAYLLPAPDQAAESCIDFQLTFTPGLLGTPTPHAYEMVYIPRGAYELGAAKSLADRNRLDTSQGSLGAPLNAFYQSDGKGTYQGAFQITSEAEIAIGGCDTCLNYRDAVIPGVNTYSGDRQGKLGPDFPKGFAAFYQMRYELTEQQYCDFLNALRPEQARARIDLEASFAGADRAAYGNFIVWENGKYTTSVPDQACSFLSWNDCLALADWAGMRIMTELEYEKSARGTAPAIFREYAWGSSELEKGYYLDQRLFACDRGKDCVDGNVHVNLLGFDNFDDVCGATGSDPDYIGCRILSETMAYRGPLRTGIHSQGKTPLSRLNSGAGFYGSLELSGNVREPVVPVGDRNSRNYVGVEGDGRIAADGSANTPAWHYAQGDALVYGYRGGCWAFHENHARIADRFNVYRTGPDVRKPYSGFRGVKNATLAP
ncbi:MAG: SUMF1/EgtB/PvdO family nonheme iron enzyme [Bacteroidota bacterium]